LDALEASVLARTVGRRAPITATRGAIGHFGGAGALAVAVAALALHHARVPPTAGCRLPARDALDVVVGESRAHGCDDGRRDGPRAAAAFVVRCDSCERPRRESDPEAAARPGRSC
jgi:hypothetical protein